MTGAIDRRIANMPEETALPRRNGELVFEAPWEGRAFGMAVALSDRQLYSWDEFRDHLIAEIRAAEARGEASSYYERWLAAFERLLLERGILSAEEIERRVHEIATGQREDIF